MYSEELGNGEERLIEILNEFRLREIRVFKIKSKPLTSLTLCLSKLSKAALETRSRYLGLDQLRRLKKAELIDLLSDYYIKTENVEKIVSWATEAEISILKSLMRDNFIEITVESFPEVFNHLRYLFTTGLIHVFEEIENRFTLVLQDEIKERFDVLDWSKVSELNGRNFMIMTHCRAAVSLYGAVSLLKLHELYEYYNGAVNQATFLEGVYDAQIRSQSFWVYDGHLYSDYFDVDDLNSHLLFEILDQEKPYYIPELSEFIKYAEPDFEPENKYLDEMMVYLQKFAKLTENQWDDLRLEILYTIELGELRDTLQELESRNIVFETQREIDGFMKRYVPLVNNTRIWSNHGFTPEEIRKISKPTTYKAEEKVGRNDPCSCGSGKKYKKCCGSN